MQTGSKIACLLLSFLILPQVFGQTTIQSRLELTLAKAWERTDGIPGVGVVVITADNDTIFASVGEGNIYNETAIDINTQFFVASISKTFTSALILRLQDADSLDIDDLLKDYLVIEGISEDITIRHLLNHSSGIYDHFSSNAFWSEAVQNPNKIWSNEEVLAYSNSVNPYFAPGTNYSYCNTGFFILGMLAAEITGKTTAQAMKQWVLDPLGLKRTFLDDFSNSTLKIPDLAENNRAYEYHKTLASTAGAMVSTPKEVSKFMEGVFTTDFLSESALIEMLTPSANNAAYALGTRIWVLDNKLHYGHTGTLTGYRSYAFHIPSIDYTVAIHANGYAININTWLDLIDDVFFQMVREASRNCTEGCPPPKIPLLLSVAPHITDIKRVQWIENTEPYVIGYRLYYAPVSDPENWKLIADEDRLKRQNTQFTFRSGNDFQDKSLEKEFLIKLVAVLQDFTESAPSDIQALSLYNTVEKALIVDGFDRWSGSWDKESHAFVADYMRLLSEESNEAFDIYTTSNEQVIDGKVNINDYKYVIWFLGDESTVQETFSAEEQILVSKYLERGGNLFVTGAEIAWDLDAKGSDADRSFFNDYLKASYVDDGAEGYTPAKGVENTLFQGLTLSFGAVYPEDFPDAIEAQAGAELVFKYEGGRDAGIAYSGLFGASTTKANLVYLAFPFESVANQAQKRAFIKSLFEFFDGEDILASHPLALDELEMLPNPARNHTNLSGTLLEVSQLKILDMKGVIKNTVNIERLDRDVKKYKIDVSGLPAGNYIVLVTTLQGEKAAMKLIKK